MGTMDYLKAAAGGAGGYFLPSMIAGTDFPADGKVSTGLLGCILFLVMNLVNRINRLEIQTRSLDMALADHLYGKGQEINREG